MNRTPTIILVDLTAYELGEVITIAGSVENADIVVGYGGRILKARHGFPDANELLRELASKIA